jgi:predicted negative regulator of RcsB-dependent stress response
MLPNTEDIQRLLDFVRANIAGVVIGVLIGGGVVSWAYESFLLKSIKIRLQTINEKYDHLNKEYDNLAAVKSSTTTSSTSAKIGQSTAVGA